MSSSNCIGPDLLKKEGAGWQRIVVEKPFGHDLASAQALNHELTRFANETAGVPH